MLRYKTSLFEESKSLVFSESCPPSLKVAVSKDKPFPALYEDAVAEMVVPLIIIPVPAPNQLTDPFESSQNIILSSLGSDSVAPVPPFAKEILSPLQVPDKIFPLEITIPFIVFTLVGAVMDPVDVRVP